MTEPTTEAGRSFLAPYLRDGKISYGYVKVPTQEIVDLILAIEAEATARVGDAARFMLALVDEYYGTDHEFDLPDEAEFRRHRAVIEIGRTPVALRGAADKMGEPLG